MHHQSRPGATIPEAPAFGSEELLVALRAAGVAASILDLETGVGVTTPEWADVIGLPPDPATQTFDAFLALVHPDDRARVAALHADPAAMSRGLDFEFRVNHPVRGERWLQSRSLPVSNAGDGAGRLVGVAFDITERKRTELVLRESEEWLQSALSIQTVGVLFFTLDGRMSDANAAFERMSGYSRDNLRAIDDWQALTPPEFAAVTARAAEELATRGETAPYEKQMIRKDGSRFWGLFAPTRLSGAGRESECVEFILDITDRKRVEESLRANEARLQRMMNIEGVGILVFDETGTLLDANDAFLTMTGYTRAAIGERRLTWRTMTLSEYVAISEEQMHRLARTGRIGPYEKEYLRADGSRSWMMFAGAALGAGTIVEYCIDVSDRKRVEAALRASEARYRALTTASTDVVYRMGPDWTEMRMLEGRGFLADTPAASAPWLETYIAPEDQPYVIAAIQQAVATRTPFELEYRVRRADGTVGWTQSRAVPVLDEQGEIAEWIGSATDVTIHKAAEAVLRESEERQAFLLRLSDALRLLADPVEIQAEACRQLGEHLGIDRAYYVEVDEARQYARVARDYLRGDSPSLTGEFPLAEYGWSVPHLRQGKTVVVADVEHDDIVPRSDRPAMAAIRIAAHVSVPVIKTDALVGALCVTEPTPREWSAADVEFVHATAERLWEAIERARIEAALRASEARYRTLFESIDEGFCVFEVIYDAAERAVDYRFLEVNDAFERQTGLHDVAGKLGSEVAPNTERTWFDAYDRVLRTGEPLRLENHHDATGRWYEAYASRVGDAGSRLVCTVFNDVTERKSAERHQTLLSEISRELIGLDSIPETMTRLGEKIARSFAVRYCMFAELTEDLETSVASYGWHAEGTLSLAGIYRMRDFLSDEQHLAHNTGVPTIVSDTQTDPRVSAEAYGALAIRSFVIIPLARGGQWRFLLSIIDEAPRQWRDDEVESLSEIANRIWARLERARAENALRESEERYRRIVEQATDYAIFTTDVDSRIDTWPSGAQRVFGWTAEDAVGQPFAITFTPEDRAAGVPQREVVAARVAGQTPNVRWHQHKDGARVFIEGTTYARQGEDGSFRGVFKIGQDVTARLMAEEARGREEARRREDLEAEVEAHTLELRILSRRLLTVQEEERRHLARELHDEVGQMLTGLNFQLAAAAGKAGQGALAEAQATVQTLTEQVRQLSMDLRPAVLDSFGLLAAVQWHLERHRQRTGIAVDLRHHGLGRRFAPEVEITAYRVVQEALTNVARHAGTDTATVHLFADEDSLTVRVRDAGRGFDPEQAPVSSGLGGIRERVALLAGRVEIEAQPDRGTTVTAEIPLTAGDIGDLLDAAQEGGS